MQHLLLTKCKTEAAAQNQCLAQRLAQALDAVQGGAVATSAIVIEGLRDTAKRLQGVRVVHLCITVHHDTAVGARLN